MTADGRINSSRKAALALASVGVNAGLILALSLNAIGQRPVERSDLPLILVEIEPRPLLRDERPRPPLTAPQPDVAMRSRTREDIAPAPRRRDPAYEGRSTPVQPRLAVQTLAGAPAPEAAWRVDSTDRRGAMSRSLRLGATGCASPELLNEAERRRCRDRFGERTAAAPQITGSGDAERDAVFARQGARRLAAWEAQRRSPARGDPPCETSHPMAGCEGVNIQVDLFSSRDGFLPNQRKGRE